MWNKRRKKSQKFPEVVRLKGKKKERRIRQSKKKNEDSRMGKSPLYLAFQRFVITSFCVNGFDGSGLKVTDS